MSQDSVWREALADITGKPMTDVMARRLVNRQHLESSVPPDYLFTSGRPGRFNPRGVQSIYASDNLITAAAEWERYWNGLPESYLMYFVQFSGLMLDLGDPNVLEQLKIDPKELFDSWKFAEEPTRCQVLGQLVAGQKRLAGIRFPSDAARERGIEGFNYVLFKDAVASPAKVEVRSDEGVPVQGWPFLLGPS